MTLKEERKINYPGTPVKFNRTGRTAVEQATLKE
jgi:hypothetical protein